MICELPAKQLKLVVDSLKDILAQCWFFFDADGISLRNVDPEKIVVAQLHWKPNGHYECPEPLHFSLYIHTLYRILRSVRPQSTVRLEQTSVEVLSVDVLTQNDVPYHVQLHSLQDPVPRFLSPVYEAMLEIPFVTATLYRMLHDLAALSRTVRLEVLPTTQTLRMSATDANGTVAQIEHMYPLGDGPVPPMSQTFLLKYLEKFTKPAVAETLTLRFHSHAPLRVRYDWDCGFLELSIAGLV